MKIEKIYIGGWFQRTTLHLTEIYDFVSFGKSEVGLFSDQLEKYRLELDFSNPQRVNWLLEYIKAEVKDNIVVRIYEDGLIALEMEPEKNLKDDLDRLEKYYDNNLSPAISFLFSKGAPVPKELASMKSLLPFVLVTNKATKKEIEEIFTSLGLETYTQIEEKSMAVYKSSKVILMVSDLNEEKLRQVVESQIFFREFKAQLHRYLNIHRLVWEEIAAIKEKGKIAGNEVRALRNKLDNYQKTIKLIESRINQMGCYLKTRAKVTTSEQIGEVLDKTFAMKFETLEDTLSYIKDLWKMTDNYLNSAIQMFSEIQTESTKTSITSLQLITTLGVVASIITYLGRDKLPPLTLPGLVFFTILLISTWAVNSLVVRYYSKKSYLLKREEGGRWGG